jgi:hypothetical protein
MVCLVMIFSFEIVTERAKHPSMANEGILYNP